MRFGVRFRLNPGEFLPSDYRRHALSFIKEALKSADESLFEQYYSKQNKQKPFTFSLSFKPSQKKEKGKIYLQSHEVVFHFSSFDAALLITLYNGIREISKNKNLNYFNNILTISNIFYINTKNITYTTITFKTLSPILVRDIEDKKGKGFLKADDPIFFENLFFNVKSMAREFLKYDLQKDEFNVVDHSLTHSIASLYGGEIANKGLITIKAPIPILELVYHAGIGAKRSQGFGMLEVMG